MKQLLRFYTSASVLSRTRTNPGTQDIQDRCNGKNQHYNKLTLTMSEPDHSYKRGGDLLLGQLICLAAHLHTIERQIQTIVKIAIAEVVVEITNHAIHAVIHRAQRRALTSSTPQLETPNKPREVSLKRARRAVEQGHLVRVIAPEIVKNSADVTAIRPVACGSNKEEIIQALLYSVPRLLFEELGEEHLLGILALHHIGPVQAVNAVGSNYRGLPGEHLLRGQIHLEEST